VNTEKPWYIVDASDKILGRLASTIAIFIRGKNLATYTPSVDSLHTHAYCFLHDDNEEYALYNINLEMFKRLVLMVPGLGKTNLIFMFSLFLNSIFFC